MNCTQLLASSTAAAIFKGPKEVHLDPAFAHSGGHFGFPFHFYYISSIEMKKKKKEKKSCYLLLFKGLKPWRGFSVDFVTAAAAFFSVCHIARI